MRARMADTLPIYEIEGALVAALRRSNRLILSAPTGSGKSTQVPQMLLQHGLLEAAAGRAGQVVVLQPRRLATRLLAARVAEELGVPLGGKVGYQIRFENVTSRETRIRFVTEGVLLRQMIEDPSLPGVAAIVFDEFHERHLYGDITLARALDIQESARPDLKLIVMSATLEAESLRKYLSEVRTHGSRITDHASSFTCTVLSSSGRTFPVEVHYANTPSYEQRSPVWEQAADAFAHFVQSGGAGDVLVFMPGAYEIAQTLEAIGRCKESRGFRLLPLHGELNPKDQDAAVARYQQRKVVVATNVAETSLTIDGIRLVIDSGLARIPRFDPYRGINTLLIEKISQASADQRTGRAGRTAPGECCRLWTEAEHRDRPVQEKPEVQRLDLAEVVLTLKAAGVTDLHSFRWLEHPGDQRLAHAEELLVDLGALEKVASSFGTARQDESGLAEDDALPPHPQSLSPEEREEAARPPASSAAPHQVTADQNSLSPRARAGVRGKGAPAEQPDPDHHPCPAPADPQSRVGPTFADPRGDRLQTCPTSITPLGRRMLAFPLHPRYARMLLAAEELGCVHQACLIAALTQGRDLLVRKVDSGSKDKREDVLGDKAASDFLILMRAWKFADERRYDLDACKRMGIHALTARQVGPLLQQFLRIAAREDLDVTPREVPDDVLQKCLLIGFSDRVARRLDQGTLRCELVHGRRGVLARESSVRHSPLIVVAEIREVGRHDGETNTILSLATEVHQAWLEELFPGDIGRELEVRFDAQARRVYARELRTFRGLQLEAKNVEPPPLDQAAALLAEQVATGKLALNDWDHGVEQWITRLNLLAKWCPEFELPPVGAEERRSLIEQFCHGAFTYKDIKDRPVKAAVKDWLNPLQRQMLDDHAPERLKLSNGKTPKVVYSETEPPHASLRIQELYDVMETPKIALGRVPVLLHILAPNMRPVQITQDLAGFWREHYPRVKSELQRKYPKHQWR
jgi:HrpA-like RNA helicase